MRALRCLKPAVSFGPVDRLSSCTEPHREGMSAKRLASSQDLQAGVEAQLLVFDEVSWRNRGSVIRYERILLIIYHQRSC